MGEIRKSMSMLAAVGIALILAGCTSTDSGGGTSAPPSPSPVTSDPAPAAECPETLTATLESDPNATPGVFYIAYSNSGDVACEVVGFPLIRWVIADGSLIGHQSESDVLSLAETVVVVAPGESAYSWLHVIDASTSSGDCAGTSATASGLSITVPGAEDDQHLPLEATVCSDPERMAEIQVGPVDAEQRASSKGY